MSYTYKKNLANKNNYGGRRNTAAIQYVVVHYTGNDGDSDEANANYFRRNIVRASAHYFVDDDSVTQSVPDDYVAWSVGGKKYTNCAKTGGGTMYGKCTNANSLSVELCDTVKDGKVYPSVKTIENALSLVRELMKKYNVPVLRVIRHFDVTGKACPAYWSGSAAKDKLWNSAFHDRLTGTSDPAVSINTQTAGSQSKSYKVKITADSLRVRSGPDTSYKAVTSVKKNQVYTIVEEKNEWGLLKSKVGWISLAYTTKV